MKSIAFILLAALLISQTVTQGPQSIWLKTLDIVGPLTATAFGCLHGDGYQVAIVRAYSLDNGGSVDPNAVQTLVNAQSVGLYTQIYMVICRNGDAVSQVDAVTGSILSSQYGNGAWIKVEPNTVAGCQWPTNDPAGNCAFLTTAVYQFQTNGISIGIFSTANIWNSFFGSSCDNFAASMATLWFADYNTSGQMNSDPSPTDFVPFGGWVSPVMKQIGGDVHVTSLCNNPNWHVFIDIGINYQ